MTLDIDRINVSLDRSGYAHVSREVGLEKLQEFCAKHLLAVSPDGDKPAFYTYTLRRSGVKVRATAESLRDQLAAKKKGRR